MLKQVYIAIFGIDMPIYTKNMKLGEYGYYPERNPNLKLNFLYNQVNLATGSAIIFYNQIMRTFSYS